MKRLSVELGDMFAGVLFAGIGAAAIAEAIRLYPYRSTVWVGDHTAPAMLGSLLLLLGIMTALRKRNQAATAVEMPPRHTALRMLRTFAFISAYCAGLPVIGYTAATSLAAALLFWSLGVNAKMPTGMRAAAVLLWSLLTTALLYGIFGVWLRLPLPGGLWDSF